MTPWTDQFDALIKFTDTYGYDDPILKKEDQAWFCYLLRDGALVLCGIGGNIKTAVADLYWKVEGPDDLYESLKLHGL